MEKSKLLFGLDHMLLEAIGVHQFNWDIVPHFPIGCCVVVEVGKIVDCAFDLVDVSMHLLAVRDNFLLLVQVSDQFSSKFHEFLK